MRQEEPSVWQQTALQTSLTYSVMQGNYTHFRQICASLECPVGTERHKMHSKPLRFPFNTRPLPLSPTHRLCVTWYHLISEALPNQSPRPNTIISEATLRLGCEFYTTCRIIRIGNEKMLELPPFAYDLVRRIPAELEYSPELLSSITELMAKAHTAALIRLGVQGKGQN